MLIYILPIYAFQLAVVKLNTEKCVHNVCAIIPEHEKITNQKQVTDRAV